MPHNIAFIFDVNKKGTLFDPPNPQGLELVVGFKSQGTVSSRCSISYDTAVGMLIVIMVVVILGNGLIMFV